MLAAERAYERSRAGAEPEWLGFYTEAALAADLGRWLTDLGDPDQGSTPTGTALRGFESWRVRAHLLRRDPDQTAALGRDALRTATEISSHRVLERLRILQRQVTPLLSASPLLADLDDRITGFLTRRTPNGGRAPTSDDAADL